MWQTFIIAGDYMDEGKGFIGGKVGWGHIGMSERGRSLIALENDAIRLWRPTMFLFFSILISSPLS